MKFDWWLALGFTAQTLFGFRFAVQWFMSERKKKSFIPLAFWYFSLGGGVLLLTYALHRRDPVFILGQSAGLFVYARNLYFIFKEKRAQNESVVEA